ncbi:extensin-like [Hibiscus syriacus]|uniref:extensin-like n=1 Tax=Hibiscus syriacus TaxID=106335 RepID=UPI001921D1A0|nr:extensin-like [Hibiscus syriacus]
MPSPPVQMPPPQGYMANPTVHMPLSQGYIPSPHGYIPSPQGYIPSPQGFMTPHGGAYMAMLNDPTYGSYTSYLADSSPPPQTPPPPYGSHTSMSIFSQFSHFSLSGGIISNTPPGSLFYTCPSLSSMPNEQNVDDDDDSEDKENEEEVIRRNP